MKGVFFVCFFAPFWHFLEVLPPRCWWQLSHICSLVDAPLQDSAEGDLKPPWVAQTPHLCLPFCEEDKFREWVTASDGHTVYFGTTSLQPRISSTLGVCVCIEDWGGGWKAWSKALPHTHRPCCVPSLPEPLLWPQQHRGTCTPALSSPIPPPISLHHLSLSSHIHYRAGQLAFAFGLKREGEREREKEVVKQREAEGAYDTKGEREREREREGEIRA